MKKLDPEQIIAKLHLSKDEVFEYLDTHQVKEFREKYNLPVSTYRCIINYWGGYTVSSERRALIARENGKQSISTKEKLEQAKHNGAGNYRLFDDVLAEIDVEEFYKDYTQPLTKKQLAAKYNCTKKMINKIINYFGLHCSKENICKINSLIKTEETKSKQHKAYIQTMQRCYNVDNYFQSNEFKEKIKARNNDLYGVDWYCQSDEFRNKYKVFNFLESIRSTLEQFLFNKSLVH